MQLTDATDLARQIAFIDTGLPYWEIVAANVPEGVEIVLLDPLQDGVLQIAAALEDRDDLDAIHILSHGATGSLQLGTAVLDQSTLPRYEVALQAIGEALTDGGDILLYGCNVAAGDAGQAFIAALAEITGADVAASVDPTGTAVLGGDWDLEASSGLIETATMAMTGGTQSDGSRTLAFLLADPGDEIVRVSADSGGAQANNDSGLPQISADGRYVVFQSDAGNLVAGDTNGRTDIFVKDLQTGITTRVSTDSGGGQANAPSEDPAISADGRYVVFSSSANNLVAGDTNGAWDVFVKDLLTGTTTRVSTDSSGGQTTSGGSFDAAISADGRYVVFYSAALNLVPGSGFAQVFVKDLQTGITRQVSTDSSGIPADTSSHEPQISADGRYVVFETSASNLVSDDTDRFTDIFVKDLLTGITARVSTDSNDTQANQPSHEPQISADGRYAVFETSASNLVPDDTNRAGDIFVKDLLTGTTTRVSTDSSGGQANSSSKTPAISADGRYVVFTSAADNLVPDDTNRVWDTFVKDLHTGAIARVNVSSSGAEANDFSVILDQPAISADGRYIVFASAASNLVAEDTNGAVDVFRVVNPLYSGGPDPQLNDLPPPSLKTLADFSLAAYALRDDEPLTTKVGEQYTFLNDPNEEAETARTSLRTAGWTFLDDTELGSSLALTLTTRNGDFHFGMLDGVYTNENAGALVARDADSMVIAFRGTNDGRYANAAGNPLVGDSPDQDHWIGMDDHWDLFGPLSTALDSYLSRHPEITTVYVTGHSLGAGMVQAFMAAHPGARFEAVTFASPGYMFAPTSDGRIVNLWVDGDKIQSASFYQDNAGDRNEAQLDIAWITTPPEDISVAKHSMAFYSEVASRLTAVGLDSESLVDLNGNNYADIYLSIRAAEVEVIDRALGPYNRIVCQSPDGATTNGSWSSGSLIIGTAGSDTLTGGLGNDALAGGAGRDTVSGGLLGTDTAVFTDHRSDYTILVSPDGRAAVAYNPRGGDGFDILTGVEQTRFAGVTSALAPTNSILEYTASYDDLISTFGLNQQAAFDHFVNHGYAEGRNVTFSALEYIASYPDLLAAFGASQEAGAWHYLSYGRAEGRGQGSFDGLEYIASNPDLIAAFGADQDAGAWHYIALGKAEGRGTGTFDGLRYIASNADLSFAFGADRDAGSMHYINTGYAEGRGPGGFDGLQYIASYPDLIQAFAANGEAGTLHYLTKGFAEGRDTDDFDATQYLDNYPDLQAAFGTNEEAATVHYILYGFAEGRVDVLV